MSKAAILIDGGYMGSVLKKQFNEPVIEYDKLAQWACQKEDLFRVYYYDCLPYQSKNPSPEERSMMSRKQAFFSYLRRLDRFTVREGRLEYRGTDTKGNPIFQQKRVDLQIGLDIATLVFRDRIDTICVISGDSDLLPVVELAKNYGIIARLVHGRIQTYHQDLWDNADERCEITQAVIDSVARK
jgi:uncharacterized LabA/DUF88 family protein